MKTIHYAKSESAGYVLAEQNEDKTWCVPGWHQQLRPVDFLSMWTDEPPCPYQFFESQGGDAPDPNRLVRAGTHTLQECNTVDEVRALEGSVPGVQFLEPGLGFIYRELPLYFTKEGPIEEFEEIPVVGAALPLIAIIPVEH